MSLFKSIRATAVLFVAPLLTIAVSLVALCDLTFFRKSKEKAQVFPKFWGSFICKLAGVKVSIKGLENIQKDSTYIFAGNHSSQFDIFCFQGYYPYAFRWIAKKELLKVPFLGQTMKGVGTIFIDRSHGREALKSLGKAAQQIAEGASVLIFPEGTRSPDGKLHEFKTGAILLAIKSGVPVVPIAFQGTYDVMPKGKLFTRSGHVTIRIGQPIATENYVSRDKQQLASSLHDKVQKLLETNIDG